MTDNKLLKKISTATTRSLKGEGVFGSRRQDTELHIPLYATFAQDQFARLEAQLQETLSIYGAFKLYDNLISTQAYNMIVDELQANYDSLRKQLNVKGWSVVVVKHGVVSGVKIIDSDIALEHFCNSELNTSAEMVKVGIVAGDYAGTKAFEQDWLTPYNEVFSKMKLGT
jgi:hypothetical protein